MLLSSHTREESNLVPVHRNNGTLDTTSFCFSSTSREVGEVFRTSPTPATCQGKCSPPVTCQFRVLFDANGPVFVSGEERPSPGPSAVVEDGNQSKRDSHRRYFNGIKDDKKAEHEQRWKECTALAPPITPSPIPSPATTTPVVCTSSSSSSFSPLSSPVHPVQFFSKPDEVVIPVRQPLSSVTVQDFTHEFMRRLQYKYPEIAQRAVVSHYLVCQSDEERKEKEGDSDLPVPQSEKRARHTSLRCGQEEMKRLSVPSFSPLSLPPLSTGPSPPFASLPSSSSIRHYWRIDAKMNQYDALDEFFWTRPWTLPLSHPHAFRNAVLNENSRGDEEDGRVVRRDAAALDATQMCTTTTTMYDLIVQWEMPASCADSSSLALPHTNPAPLFSLTHPSSSLVRHGATEKPQKGEEHHDDDAALTAYTSLGDRLRLYEAQKTQKAMQDLFFSPPKPVIHVTQRSTYLDLLSMRRSRREEAQEQAYKKFLARREKALAKKEKKKFEKQRQSALHRDGKEEDPKMAMKIEEGGTPCTTEGETNAKCGSILPTVHHSRPSLRDRPHRSSLSSSSASSHSSRSSDCTTDTEGSSEVDTPPEDGIVRHQTEKHYHQRLRLEIAQRTARQTICQKEMEALDALREVEREHCYHIYTLERLAGNTMENGVWPQWIQSHRGYPMDTQPTFDEKKIQNDQVWRRAQGNHSAATSFAFRQLLEKKKNVPHRERSSDSDEEEEECDTGSRECAVTDTRDARTDKEEKNVRERIPFGEEDATHTSTEPSFRDVMMDMVVAELELQKMEKQTAAIFGRAVVHRSSAAEEQEEQYSTRKRGATTDAASCIPMSSLAAPSTTSSSPLPGPLSSRDDHHLGEEKKNASTLEELLETEAYQEALDHYLDWRHEIISIERKDFREMVYLMQEVLVQQAAVDRAAVELAYEEEWKAAAPLWDRFSSDSSPFLLTEDLDKEEKKKDGHIEEEAKTKEEDNDTYRFHSGTREEVEALQMPKEEDITWRREENRDRETGVGDESAVMGTPKREMEQEEESDEAFRKRNRNPRYRIVTDAIEQLDAHAGERLQERLAKCREEYRKRVEKARMEKEAKEEEPSAKG